MKVLVLGSSGIIGQHLRAATPPNVEATFCRRFPSPGFLAANLKEDWAISSLLRTVRPDVVVNLAGESNTDEVEAEPERYEPINVNLPKQLAWLCGIGGIRLIQISTQAVFSGETGDCSPLSLCYPANQYGRQKVMAEHHVQSIPGSTIIRPTFVLGVRPDSTIGRRNPIEAMLSGQRKQVSDRYFSVSFAPDVAHCIWQAAVNPDPRRIIHAGIPFRTSRYQIACDLGLDVEPVSHDDFPGLAPRPLDTTYSEGEHRMGYAEGLKDCLRRWEARQAVAA